MYFNASTIVFHNGEFQKASDAVTNLYNQTMHYGYGVFEGIRSYNTDKGVKIFKAKEHYDRLIQSGNMIHIPVKYSSSEMEDLTYELLKKNGFKDAYIRPLVYCSPNMGLTSCIQSFLFIAAWEWGAYLGDKQLSVMISSYSRPHPKSTKIEAKVCGHYVNSILASTEAKTEGFDESVLLDTDGNLAEGPGSNLFFEKDGKLYTPALGHILPGITRETIIQLAGKMNIPVEEGTYSAEHLITADSAFLCGTGAEVIGIKSINGVDYKKSWSDSLGARLKKTYLNLVRNKSIDAA